MLKLDKSALEKASFKLFLETRNKNHQIKVPVKDEAPVWTDSDDDKSNEDLSVYCNESYLNSKPNEGWIRYQSCEMCSGVEEDTYTFSNFSWK